MKKIVIAIVASFLLIGNAIANPTAPILKLDEIGTIKDEYIIVFRDDARQNISALASTLAKSFEAEIMHEYHHVFRGVSARVPRNALEGLSRHPAIAFIEANGMVTGSAGSWGIDRIDQRNLPLNGIYQSNFTGAGVRVYVVDTGVRASHQEFGDRVLNGHSVIGGASNQDCNGHGTHVAGTIAGNSFGVARGATIFPVKVLDCNNEGTIASVVAGLDWIRANNDGRTAVVNISINPRNGGTFANFDTAVQNLYNAGIIPIASAGNRNENACGVSPGATSAITVASSMSNDGFYRGSGKSNFGSCVDIIAPGVDIVSASHTSNTGSATLTGTSMAAPHVTGILALYLDYDRSLSPAELRTKLLSNATNNKVSNVPSGTTQSLAYSGFTEGQATLSAQTTYCYGLYSANITTTLSNPRRYEIWEFVPPNFTTSYRIASSTSPNLSFNISNHTSVAARACNDEICSSFSPSQSVAYYSTCM